jgi:hypothetical protein
MKPPIPKSPLVTIREPLVPDWGVGWFFVGPEEERMTGALITGIVTLGLLIYLLVSHNKPDLFS